MRLSPNALFVCKAIKPFHAYTVQLPAIRLVVCFPKANKPRQFEFFRVLSAEDAQVANKILARLHERLTWGEGAISLDAENELTMTH